MILSTFECLIFFKRLAPLSCRLPNLWLKHELPPAWRGSTGIVSFAKLSLTRVTTRRITCRCPPNPTIRVLKFPTVVRKGEPSTRRHNAQERTQVARITTRVPLRTKASSSFYVSSSRLALEPQLSGFQLPLVCIQIIDLGLGGQE